MAQTASKTFSETLKELEAEITCLVCQGHYTDAKLLPCMHYYCKSCIEELWSKCAARKGFPCPECREDTFLPPDGVSGLKSAFFVERMKDFLTKIFVRTAETPCGVCKGEATLFCRECAVFYCSGECITAHSREHHVICLEPKAGSEDICTEHGESMSVFCFTCDMVFCRDCIISSHSGHSFNTLKKCALEKRGNICKLLIPLHKTQADISDTERKVVETEKAVGRQGMCITDSIRNTFAELRSIIDQREAELVSIATAFVEEKKDALERQKKVLQVEGMEIRSLVDFVETIIENVSDKEMMECFVGLQKQVLEEGKRHHRLSSEPVTTADIVCHLPPLSIIPDDMGSIYCQPKGLQATVQPLPSSSTTNISDNSRPTILQFTDACNVHQQSKMTLRVNSFREVTVSDLQSKGAPSVTVTPKVTAKGDGVFEISYTPTVRGRHDLVVKVDGRDIPRSPFRIFASICAGNLGNPVKIMEGFGGPVSVTFNHNEELVVAETSSRRLAILNRQGVLLRTIIADSRYLKMAKSVAVGPERSFFVTSLSLCVTSGAGSLLKLDDSGRILRYVPLQSPLGMKVIHDCLYVCTGGVVAIFDMDCTYIDNLVAECCPKPCDIAATRDCLYVVNNATNSVIAEFSMSGQFRRVFAEGIPHPLSICVSSTGLMFITLGRKKRRVMVLGQAGQILARFGQRDSWLRNPSGIAVDEDGFVYVCDTSQNRVVVF